MRSLATILLSVPLIAAGGGVARDGSHLLFPAAERPSPPPAADSGVEKPVPSISAIGVVLPVQATDVGAPYAGRLQDVHVRLGDRVEAGAVIASLTRDLSRQDLEMARAGVAAATAELQRAELEQARLADKAGRLAKLAGAQLATAEELDEGRFAVAESAVLRSRAQAELNERRARVAQLAVTFALAEVRAPFSGAIVHRYIDAGALVSPGQPIVRIIEDSSVRIRFAVREADAQQVALGARIRARSRSAPDAPPLDAVIDRIAPDVDVASRTLFAEASTSIDPQVGPRVLGAIVSVDIETREEVAP